MAQTCGHKNGYKSMAQAGSVRELAYKNNRKKKLRIYECPDCHMWHLTSQVNEYEGAIAWEEKRRARR